MNPILGAPLHYQARRCITRRAAALPVAQWGAQGLDRGLSSTQGSGFELDQGVPTKVRARPRRAHSGKARHTSCATRHTPRARHTSSATHLGLAALVTQAPHLGHDTPWKPRPHLLKRSRHTLDCFMHRTQAARGGGARGAAVARDRRRRRIRRRRCGGGGEAAVTRAKAAAARVAVVVTARGLGMTKAAARVAARETVWMRGMWARGEGRGRGAGGGRRGPKRRRRGWRGDQKQPRLNFAR